MKEQKERKTMFYTYVSCIAVTDYHIQGMWNLSHKTVSAGSRANQIRKKCENNIAVYLSNYKH